LSGLDPKARYRVRLINADETSHLSRGTPAIKSGAVELSGQALMGQGLTLPWSFPERIRIIEGERL